MAELDAGTRAALSEYLLRLGDDRLVLGHRLSEWCGHGPILEEDLALTNAALDLVGQAQLFLGLAAELEGNGRSADDLAYFRDDTAFRNLLMLELPHGDYAFTIARNFLFSAFSHLFMQQLQTVTDEALAGLAARSLKETTYHLRHAGQWILRFGDGTPESHDRAQRALDDLWPYTAELFDMGAIDTQLLAAGLAVDLESLRAPWHEMVADIVTKATLAMPDDGVWQQHGGRRGMHTEHLGHMLAEMQHLARSHPGAEW